ncbi:MAG: RHS repeat-associated core domain-containing protein [Candidatus Binatia bacterium]
MLAASLCGATAGRAASLQTTTFTYSRNADGAPTAVTTQVDGQPAQTVYLSWDNFTANSDAPTTGTVSAGDGNLLGIGPSPGTSELTMAFTYDVRDRLTGCTPARGPAAAFAYHPASLMASSTLGNRDALQFYYDNTATPLMTNVRQQSSGLTSSFLEATRYLSDGSEQVLLQPRKDTAGVYRTAEETLTPYAYDPYGAPLSPAPTAADEEYDLTENPFQYAGEYRDRTCDIYYLRARWYLPGQQTFLSRDPGDLLHRFNYTAGDPIGRTDPSGLKFTGEDFSRDVDKAVRTLTPGVWAYIEPILPVWGEVMGGVELVGELPSFWHHPTIAGDVEFGVMAASIVTEVVGETPWFDTRFATPNRAFGARIGLDLTLNGAMTATQADQHGHLDPEALIQGTESALYGVFWGRLVGGVGYRPFGLRVDDVDELALSHFQDRNNINQSLVFRVRYNTSGKASFTSPAMESLHVGNYHEAVFAISRDRLITGEIGLQGGNYTWETNWTREAAALKKPSSFIAGKTDRQLILVGKFRDDAVTSAFEWRMSEGGHDAMLFGRTGGSSSPFAGYNKFTNNCQRNAAMVRADIDSGLRTRARFNRTMSN